MRKHILILAAVLIALLFSGCGSSSATNDRNNSNTPDSGQKTDTIKLTKANWSEYLEFVPAEDKSQVTDKKKAVEYTFKVCPKAGFQIIELEVGLNVTLYYRCGRGDIEEYVERGITLTEKDFQYTIRFEQDDLINYNGRIVESVYYGDIQSVSGTVTKQ